MKEVGKMQLVPANKKHITTIAKVARRPGFFREINREGNAIEGMKWSRELLLEQRENGGICIVALGGKLLGFGMPITYTMEKKVTAASTIDMDGRLAAGSGDAVNYYTKRQETASISINVIGKDAGMKVLGMLLSGVVRLAESQPGIRRLSGFVPTQLKNAAMKLGMETPGRKPSDSLFVTLEFEGKTIRQTPVQIYGSSGAIIANDCGIFGMPSLAAQFSGSRADSSCGNSDPDGWMYDGGRGIC